MRVNAKKLGIGAGVLLAVALAWLGVSHLFAGRADAKAAVPLAMVQKRPLSVTVEASGTAQPALVVEVKSRASGQLLQLNAETGQQVPKGFLLAQVDPRDVQNALDNARAQLAAAEAKLQTSDATLKRAEQMQADGVITQQEYDSDRAQAEADRAAAQIARTNYQLAAQKMGDPTIEAPISGTIIEKDVEAGQIIASASQTVSGGTTLFKMADLSTMQIKAEVDETDIGRVQPGQRAIVSVEAYPGRNFIGTVEKVEPEAVVDQNVTMFNVLVDLDNRQGLVKPGMNADVQIQIERLDDAVVVPNDAVVNPKDASTVAQALGLDANAVRTQMQAMRGRRGTGSGTGTAVGPSASGGGRSDGSWPQTGSRSRSWSQTGSRSGSGSWSQSGSSPASAAVRPGIVFVKTPRGPEPRFVLLGLNDLDNSQVIRGVQPGDSVVLASVARLQQQQQDQQNQLRQRAGSMMGTGGGAGGRGSRG